MGPELLSQWAPPQAIALLLVFRTGECVYEARTETGVAAGTSRVGGDLSLSKKGHAHPAWTPSRVLYELKQI